jgi:sugar-specific transcriptional regulator TrmB
VAYVIYSNQEKVLTSLGLTISQARVYLALASNGPSKVAAISQISRIHRTHLYEVLKVLEKQGVIERQLESGTYVAIPIKEAAQFLVELRKKEILRLEGQIEEIADILPKKNSAVQVKREILLTSSNAYTLNRGRKYLEKAKLHVDLLQTWKRFTQLWQNYETIFEELMNRGVKVRQIVEYPSDSIQGQKFLNKQIFKSNQFELRFIPKTGGNLMIIDDEMLLVSTTLEKNLGENPILFSNYDGLLGLMQNYFAYSWNHAYNWKKEPLYEQQENAISTQP